MKRISLLALALAAPLSASAGSYANALGTCFADSTNGRERRELAQWIFMAMSAHPDMHELANISPETRTRTNQTMGKLVTRLMSEDCSEQARSAVKEEGSGALQQAFGTLGKVAMRELMSNDEVNKSISGFEPYLDHQKINAMIAPAK